MSDSTQMRPEDWDKFEQDIEDWDKFEQDIRSADLFPDVPKSDHRGTVGAGVYEQLYRENQTLREQLRCLREGLIPVEPQKVMSPFSVQDIILLRKETIEGLRLHNLELLDAKHLLENQNAIYKRCLSDIEGFLLKTVIPLETVSSQEPSGVITPAP